MGLMQLLKEMFIESRTVEKDAVRSAYPPANIDWNKFEPAGPADARSPCPMLNALCNHSVLPHNGRKITKEMAVNALMQSLNIDQGTSSVFATHAIHMNPDTTAKNFDLNHLHAHGNIEHDVSLSRNDAAFGDNHSFDPEIWAKVIATYGDAKETSFDTVSKARYGRVKASRKAHEDAGLEWNYGMKELVLSYGESALLMGTLGDAKSGKMKVEYLRVLVEQARVPYKEGWQRAPKTVTQDDMKHMIRSLMAANEEMLEETQTVGLSTIKAAESAVKNMMPNYCTVM